MVGKMAGIIPHVGRPPCRRVSEGKGGRVTRYVAIFLFSALTIDLFASQAISGPAIGQFELKDLEAGPGSLQFQSQNAYSWGQPDRRVEQEAPGEFELDDNTVIRQRHALEMEMGFTAFFKTRIGIEFEKERLDDPPSLADANGFDDLKLAEVGAEAIVVLMPRDGDGAGVGVVVEFENPIASNEAKTVLFGPILEWASGPWSASLVPTVVHFFGGKPEEDGSRDNKWDFAYAAQVMYTFSDTWALAIEAYGTVDRIGDTGTPPEATRLFGDFDQHRIGPIFYRTYSLGDRLLHRNSFAGVSNVAAREGRGEQDQDGDGQEAPSVTFGFGALAGLNDNTPDGTLKLSVEVDF